MPRRCEARSVLDEGQEDVLRVEPLAHILVIYLTRDCRHALTQHRTARRRLGRRPARLWIDRWMGCEGPSIAEQSSVRVVSARDTQLYIYQPACSPGA